MESMPRITKSGLQRSTSETEFVYTKLKTIIGSYVLLDLTFILTEKDPYFAVGPDHSQQLLLSFQGLRPWLLFGYREIVSLIICLSHISYGYSLIDLARYWTLTTLFPSRGGLWMHSSTFGSLSQILDRGLSGWWGAFWHQTFRVPFLAPATFLIREGYIEAGTPAAEAMSLLVSFLQSGLLHASGSLSSVANTKPWQPLQFFLLQAVGIVIQRAAGELLRPRLPPLPERLRRGANLVFTVLWLHLTVMLYFDDVASTGLWVKQAVPVSLFRGFGVRSPKDHWWREDGHNPAWWQTIPAAVVAVFLASALSYVFISPGKHPGPAL
ncbi:membrane bound o-acyl transferase family protein [Hirsutella rhossiliensis]|uniref:Membrane bound o-acyl transferase family domain-containing protein n=1 Tax=Hirsutella rhossiliensis TaxID=111463 RepID=A0A9P8SGH6_9HYPO|nr:membrane bound o-acyl transferase family domain-containing protein [Hirsutella rhossiliensis]KAH0962058.1 membrane bound o-acyl transferase family domain-containing protein [Hirsutella rhossiliensis]